MSVDGTPISRADLARIEAEETLHASSVAAQRRWSRRPRPTPRTAACCSPSWASTTPPCAPPAVSSRPRPPCRRPSARASAAQPELTPADSSSPVRCVTAPPSRDVDPMLDGFRHEALPYRQVDGFANACRDVVRAGLDLDSRLIVLAASDKLAAVTDALGPDAADVTFVALDEHGRNPSRISTILHTFQTSGDGRNCVGVTESIDVNRSAEALAEAQLTEFVYNAGPVGAWPLKLVCLYDTDALHADVMTVMRQSHAFVRGQDANPDYLPDQAAVLLAGELAPPPSTAWRIEIDGDGLAAMREFVRANTDRAGLGAERGDDLVLAVNEIVTNSIRYGGGHARVAMWLASTEVVCEVRDAGHVTDPLIGRFAPPPNAVSGRGVWLANRLCDLVQFRSSPAGTRCGCTSTVPVRFSAWPSRRAPCSQVGIALRSSRPVRPTGPRSSCCTGSRPTAARGPRHRTARRARPARDRARPARTRPLGQAARRLPARRLRRFAARCARHARDRFGHVVRALARRCGRRPLRDAVSRARRAASCWCRPAGWAARCTRCCGRRRCRSRRSCFGWRPGRPCAGSTGTRGCTVRYD